jgi:hypothetical protein
MQLKEKNNLPLHDRLKFYIMGGKIFDPLKAFGGEGRKAYKKLTASTIALLDKDFLLYSYENYSLQRILEGQVEKFHDRELGRSLNRFDILILRDPFNMVASMINKSDKSRKKDQQQSLIIKARLDLWKEYAREFLGLTNQLLNTKIVISFNKWVVDREYRKSLAQKLGLAFNDYSMSSVAGQSSFDGRNFNGQAAKMKVLERWKEFETDEFYNDVFRDKEINSLAKEIFEDIIYA